MCHLCCTWLMVLATAGITLAQRPNILFIYTDDQAEWTLGATGNRDIQTPVIDRLYKEGVRLDQCFATTPVCSPARASVMTSRYGTEVGITDWINPQSEPDVGLDPKENTTWVKVLADSGYDTMLLGKWHLGTRDEFHPTKHGFRRFIGARPGSFGVKDAVLEVDGKEMKIPGLSIDYLTDQAIAYLRGPHDKPFALCLHHRAPHSPYVPVAEDIWNHYRKLDPGLPIYPDLDTDQAKSVMQKYLAAVAEIDRSTGRILAALEEAGLAGNTVVIFTSDQGYNVGQHGVWHKGNARWMLNRTRGLGGLDPALQRPNIFDTSLRVPAVIRWPGVIKPGSAIEHTITGLDFYPTLVALAGARLPAGQIIRGRSFLPLLRDEKVAWNDDLYAEYSQHHYTTTHLRTYRTPQWKLVRDFLNAGKDELYHLEVDPGETNNLIASTDAAAVAAKEYLHRRIIENMRATNDPVLPIAETRPAQP